VFGIPKSDEYRQQPLTSVNSGSYNPGTISEESAANLDPANNDIMLEEFPDGPYGAATDAPRLGKSTPWRKNQKSVSAYRDANPLSSNRKVTEDEPPHDAPRGTIEGQN
jgi:hypothetical protein